MSFPIDTKVRVKADPTHATNYASREGIVTSGPFLCVKVHLPAPEGIQRGRETFISLDDLQYLDPREAELADLRQQMAVLQDRIAALSSKSDGTPATQSATL